MRWFSMWEPAAVWVERLRGMRLDARELDTRMHSCGPACGRECWVDSLRIRPAWCAHSPIGLEVLGCFVESEEDSPRCLESVH